MSAALKTFIVDRLRQDGYISAPIIRQTRQYSLQYIGRTINEMVAQHKLREIGKIGTTKYYVLPRSKTTIQDIERSVNSCELIPTAWMGIQRSPQEFITLLDPKKQATARKLFDSDDPEFFDYFTEILPAVEELCYGRRASSELELDVARVKIATFAERLESISRFIRMFLDNEHVKSGAFSNALSDYAVNRYRDGYTREEAS